MAFGWFSKKGTKDQALLKGKKLFDQGRAAEAMTYFEEALESDPASEEAKLGIRSCREALVRLNLEEAVYLSKADPGRAREHVELALKFAGAEADLLETAKNASKELSLPAAPVKKAEEPPKRMFESTCGCASPCSGGSAEECGTGEADIDDLFAFYMEGLDPGERSRLEAMGPAFQEAYVALQQGDVETASEGLSRAKKENPDSSVIPYAIGLMKNLEENPAAAEKSFALALEKDPDFGAALHHRAVTLRELKRPGDAAALLSAWLERHPDDRDAALQCAVALLEADRAEKAKELFAPIANARMRTEPAVAALWGRILETVGDATGAINAYQCAAALRPDAIDALFPLGVLLLKQGGRNAENAVKAFKQCYKLDPEHGWAYLLRIAEAYTSLGWRDEAKDMLAAAREECPDDDRAHAACDAIEKQLSTL
jgi:tetratricopeptide (TPR) repeat protein